jgi:hypothetical protein
MTSRRGVAEEHRHLAVLHPARSAGILTLHAGAGGPLLDVPPLIDYQHRTRAAQALHDIRTHIVADGIGVPPCRGQQVLQPVRGDVPSLLGDRPKVLAPQAQQ